MVTPASPADRAAVDPLEDILRHCAAAAPAPWYPRQHAKQAGVPLARLAADVELLWSEGLLRSASRPGDAVPGLVLTAAGTRVLNNPAELAALCHGPQAVRARDAAARRALREAGAPVVSRGLLVINVVVFAVGLFIATGRGAAQAYLVGTPSLVVTDVLHRLGSLSAEDLVAGQWWRLLSAAFVHGSVLHLLMNMSMLAFGFGLAESMWGRPRYLVIYLIAAFGGDCVAMAWRPMTEFPTPNGPVFVAQPVVGASGALCGVLGAIVVWVAFNGRHLPRAASTHLWTSLIATTLLLVFISLFPQVSGLGHLGGAVFGALAAVLLHIHRWRKGVWRPLALAGLVALPWLGLQAVARQRAVDPNWHKVERQVFDRLFPKERIVEVVFDGNREYKRRVAPLLDRAPGQRNDRQTQLAFVAIGEKLPPLTALARDLGRAGPYYDAAAEHDRESALQAADDLIAKFTAARDVLQNNTNSSERDEIEERQFSRQFLGRIPDAINPAISAYRDTVQPLLEQPPGRRPRAEVDSALRAIEPARRTLAELATALGEAGPYGNQTVEAARQTAERYAAARAALLEAAARCLRAGAKWTPQDEDDLEKRAADVAALRKEWEQLVESK